MIALPLFLGSLLFAGDPTTPARAGDPLPTSGGMRWGADYFPNVPLTTHEGRTVHFFDDLIKDKVVVLNFIYTSCPDACPLETAKLVEVQDLLGERVGRDIFMYSISIDPERDTPEKLREYSERFQTGPGWLFLTGKKEDIRLLRQKVGMLAADEASLQDHSLSLLIGNQATGQWMKRSPFENPYFLVSQLEGSLSRWKNAPRPGPNYADAPALRTLGSGETLFRTRCAVCHVIGAEDGLAHQGPNLLGVTERRDPAWLARWVAEPDALLAEKDPLALELFEAYRKLPMPNMRLDATEVEAVIGFMRDESRRYSASQAAEPLGSRPTDDLPPCCQKERETLVGDEPASSPAPSAEPLPFDSPSAPVPTSEPVPASERASAAVPFPRSSLQACALLLLALGGLGFVARRRTSD